MKQLILKFLAIGFAGALAAGPTAASLGQDITSLGKQMQNPDISALVEKLHLNPQQLQKVLPILQHEAPKLQAIKGSSSLSDTQKVAQTKAIQQQSDSKLKTILSPQQFSSLKNFRSLQLEELVHGATPH